MQTIKDIIYCVFNSYPAEFFKWTYPPFSFRTVHYLFWEYQGSPTNSIESGQTAVKCMLAWLYTGRKD